jgi:hypothetical protein
MFGPPRGKANQKRKLLPPVAPTIQPVETSVPTATKEPARACVAPQRLLLLLGTSRSGTSWLATALRTYENVLYSHEPLSRLRAPQVVHLVRRMKSGSFPSSEERRALLRECCKADPDSRRPHFFGGTS